MDKDTPIFDNVSLATIAKDIYVTKKSKDEQLTSLINSLSLLVTNISNAAMLVPLIKEYLDIGVRNDEILVKLSGIIQKIITAAESNTNGDFVLSDEEKKQLLSEATDLRKELKVV